jgi:hypothetical protein
MPAGVRDHTAQAASDIEQSTRLAYIRPARRRRIDVKTDAVIPSLPFGEGTPEASIAERVRGGGVQSLLSARTRADGPSDVSIRMRQVPESEWPPTAAQCVSPRGSSAELRENGTQKRVCRVRRLLAVQRSDSLSSDRKRGSDGDRRV